LKTHGWERFWWRKHQQTLQILTLLENNQPALAAIQAQKMPLECRDLAFIDTLEASDHFTDYLKAFLSTGSILSEEESLALLRTSLRPLARALQQRHTLFCSVRVGDALVSTDPQLACVVYLNASCFDRAIAVAAEQGQLEVIQSFWRNASFMHTFLPTLCDMTRHCGVLTACQAATHLCRTVPREGTRAVCRWIREQLQAPPYNVTELALSPDAGLLEVVSWLQWYVHQEHPTHYHHAPLLAVQDDPHPDDEPFVPETD